MTWLGKRIVPEPEIDIDDVMIEVPQAPPRTNVAIAALWFDPAGRAHRGVVCDLSTRGLFLEPLEHLPSSMGVGARVRVVFMARFGAAETKVDVVATVRWMGHNRKHDSKGLGLSSMGRCRG